jgi:5-methylthioadenosine/S-adenosylhomocysteine deaminase
MRPLLIEAAWVLPVAGPPLRSAGVLLDEEGRIAAIGAALAAPAGAERITLPDAVLLPGLVNVHTHLELHGLPPSAEGTAFPDWIMGIRRVKQARTTAEYRSAARAGLRECRAGGITTIADTGDSGAVLEVLAEEGGSGIGYHEVFGPHPDQLEPSLAAFCQRVAELGRRADGQRVRIGASPHAPYSVSGPLFARVARWARERRLPLAVHVAESRAETELITRGTGPFAAAWRGRGIPLPQDQPQQPVPPPGRGDAAWRSPVSWLAAHGVLGRDTLCIHAIELDEADIALLAEHDVAVAHCPVSNRAHGHGSAPLGKLLAAGVRVGLGTDSAASIGALDLFREIRAAAELAGLQPTAGLELATLGGARALGLDREVGSLVPGKRGDLVAVRIGAAVEDPAGAVVAAAPAAVQLTVQGGRPVHRAAGA